MYPKIKLHINNDNLIDIINFLDQNNVVMEYNCQELYRVLIDNKKYEEIYFFLDRGTDIKDFLNLCTENNSDVMNFLLEKMLDDSENPGEILLSLISDSNYKIISKLANIYKFRTDDIWNYLNGKPLRLAVRKGNESIIRLLLASGSKISKCVIDPIIDALITGKPDLIPILLERGSNIGNIKPEHLEICLKKKFRLCINFIYDKLTKRMLPHFKDVDITKCFVQALKNNNDELVNSLITNYQIDLNNDILVEYVSDPKNRNSLQYYNYLKKKFSKKTSKKSDSDSDADSDSDDDFNKKSHNLVKTKKSNLMI